MMPVIEPAPEFVTESALFAAKVIAAAVKVPVEIVKPVNAVVPPTAPVNVVLTVVVVLKPTAPSTVEPKEIFPEPVFIVSACDNVTALEKVRSENIVIVGTFIWIAAPAMSVNLPVPVVGAEKVLNLMLLLALRVTDQLLFK